ncbi:hypothetical protein PVL29_024471 [Vitis rotundifolia]|uniref:Alginate lyase 2 domain-containing protein n=1 Tax=Vitis rotundifolia TaxID=103349 RepID=A0AA39DAW8_VITRO|nr:hypothetical protein PVL29_024471 [Vitis rotundifolia]
MKFPYSFSLLVLVLVSLPKDLHLFCGADPMDDFTSVPLSDKNFDMQTPYNQPLEDRYKYEDGVRSLWVYDNDKPFKQGSQARPRTEIHIKDLDYSSGVWQFEGYAFEPHGTSGVTIAQIHGATEVATDLYDKWFRLNIIHNVDDGNVTVFIDGVQKFVVKDQGPGDLYFKCGIYAAPANSSNYMESRWKGIKIFKK